MTNYKNGKIYAIRSYQTEEVYIGSTCQTLSQRMAKHRGYYREANSTIKSTKILQYEDAYIELIEYYPCKTKEELRRREGEIQREHVNRVNRNIAGNTKQEFNKEYYEKNKKELDIKSKKYNEEHKEEIDEYHKKYREDNREILRIKQAQFREEHKEELKERDKKKYECCGKVLNWRHKARHEKSAYHIKNHS